MTDRLPGIHDAVALHRAHQIPENECPRWDPVRRDPLDTVQERRFKRLKKARAARAEALGIEVGLLVNSASLERLAREGPGRAREEVLESVLKGWQMEAVGGDLRSALAE
jgi:ribonuclease D